MAPFIFFLLTLLAMPTWYAYATYMLTLPRIIRSTPRAHFVPISSSKLRINPHAALHQYGSNHPLVGANPVDKSAFLTDSHHDAAHAAAFRLCWAGSASPTTQFSPSPAFVLISN